MDLYYGIIKEIAKNGEKMIYAPKIDLKYIFLFGMGATLVKEKYIQWYFQIVVI
ncbi:unnamed protein product [marine sediment metagenome]|uniref:Uncharacterized protein n=1 Tax=marine sediment metagenome TaxID=412755 RepID=X1RJH5_9ZZZZ